MSNISTSCLDGLTVCQGICNPIHDQRDKKVLCWYCAWLGLQSWTTEREQSIGGAIFLQNSNDGLCSGETAAAEPSAQQWAHYCPTVSS